MVHTALSRLDILNTNGNISYVMKGDEVEQIAWATCQYAHNTTQYYHVSYICCLGSYICPEPNCKFQSRPRLPRSASKKMAMNPLTPKNPWCKIHDKIRLQHIVCNVKMTVYTSIKEGDRHEKVKHAGDHNHPKPPPIRVHVAAAKAFRNLVWSYPTTKPIALSTGARHRIAPHEIHPCYANDDKMRSERKKILREDSALDPGDIVAFEHNNNISFITASSMKGSNGSIIMQTESMAEVLQNSTTACQTDSIGRVCHM